MKRRLQHIRISTLSNMIALFRFQMALILHSLVLILECSNFAEMLWSLAKMDIGHRSYRNVYRLIRLIDMVLHRFEYNFLQRKMHLTFCDKQ